MIRLPKRIWLLAALAAAALHLAVFFNSPPPAVGAAAPGETGLRIGLGARGGESAGKAGAPSPQRADAPSEEPPETQTQPERPDHVAPEPPQAAQEDPAPVDAPEITRAPEPTPEPEDVAAPEVISEPETTPKHEPETASEVATNPQVTEPSPPRDLPSELPSRRPDNIPEPEHPTAPQVTAAPAPQRVAPDGSEGAADNGEVSSAATAQGRHDSGAGDATEGGGSPGASASYLDALRAWLERHKDYPRRAQRRRVEGVVMLSFTVNGRGQVLAHDITQSSGSQDLDRAAEAMLRRAQPLPPIPDSLGVEEMTISVPVSFALR